MELENFNSLTDIQLLSLVKKGNQLAFNQIYHKYWKRLYSYTYNIMNDEGDTEDVLQETFINIWVKRKELKIENLKSYLYNAVRNNAISKLRKDHLSQFQENLIDNITIEASIEEQLDEIDLKKSIEMEINKLPTRCREIFKMSRYQNYSIKEISKHFNITHRTVENQLHLALKHLRNNLENIISIVFFLSCF